MILQVNGNRLRFGVAPDGTNTVYSMGKTDILSNSNWIMVTGVWNGSNLFTYYNGVDDTSTTLLVTAS
jgi:hypothetical protein